MKTLRDTGLLFGRYGRQMLRNPVWLVASVTTPILYLVLFTPLLRHLSQDHVLPAGTALDLFLPGILALVAFGSGVGPGFSLIFDVKAGVIERLRVTPASRAAILLGPILATVLSMWVLNGILVAIGASLGFSVHPAGLVVLALLLAVLVEPFLNS
ncbi:ABC transporter permease [Sulfobacillus harzensis]|uniref:ABC transporter permease n=1 Tax=Sulfobacillus harzensis TaxID=2729629 RepID=A0A7Y0L824_9FIRM|nr:ABC transporter permease [Sulfobacillus harzensis]NMP24712.1 ABC transporter permease [Sulfobacillus harzensis]